MSPRRQARRRVRPVAFGWLAVVLIAASPLGGLPSAPGRGAFPFVGDALAAVGAATIDPALEALLGRLAPNDLVPVIVRLRDRVDPTTIVPGSGERRGAAVVKAMKDRADATQGPLRHLLAAARDRGEATAAVSLWIVNGIAVAARPGVIRVLARRPEVASIVPELSIQAPDGDAAGAAGSPIQANVALVNAPALWDLGFDGSGVVVASMDTGVDSAHPDLAGTYRGGADSWFDPYGQHGAPADLNGHGTATTGVMVGGSAGGSSIGVAPDARWIAAKIFNDSGVATASAIHLAFQWLLDPDADPATADEPAVVNGSWAMGSPGCDLEFDPDLAALVAAGITPVFAAGNYGPLDGTSSSPGNNPSAFSVGAIDNDSAPAPFSSRGPTSCGRADPVPFPALTAPGVGIVSSDRGGGYALSSGTSVAAPHVSGGLALLKGAFPGATTADLEGALVASAVDLGSSGVDNTFGAGRIDLRAAYDYLAAAPTPTPTPSPSASPSAPPSPTPSASAPPAPTPTPTPSPAADTAGPVAGSPIVAPNPASGASPIAISVTLDDGATGASPVAAGEWFPDEAGAPGTGHPLAASFGPSLVVAEGTITTSELAALADGAHPILVRGRDAAGNWGAVSTTTLVVDRTGPTVSGPLVTPIQTQGATNVTLSAALTDSASRVAAAEWFIGPDPGAGAGTPLLPTDGAFDTSSEAVTASVPITGRPNGEVRVSIRGGDLAGNWGGVVTAAFAVTPTDGIFADGFESGTMSRWSSRSGSTRLSVTSAAAMAGTWGMKAVVARGRAGYLTDQTPLAGAAYHARFGFDPHGMSTANRAVDVLTGIDSRGRAVFRLQYRRAAGGPRQIRLGAVRPGGTTWTAWSTVSAGPHSIELGWASSRSTRLRLWLDGVARPASKALDTRGHRLEAVRLGPSAGLTTSMNGSLSFDRFVSTRGSRIGP